MSRSMAGFAFFLYVCVVSGTNTGNTQQYPPGWTVFNTGLENGSISIGGVVQPKHENNKGNKVNKQPDASDASAIGATFGDSVLNGFPISGVAISSDGSIAAGDITGGNFGEGGLSFNTNGPGTNVPQQPSAVNNGDRGYQNTGANNGNIGSQNTGEQYPNFRLKGTPNDPSIAIGVISGGNYPPGSFSIGHGQDNYNTGNGAHDPNFGNTGNGQFNPNTNSGNGYVYPNIGPGQTGGGNVYGQNDIASYGGPNTPYNGPNYGVPVQNPGQKPTNPYDYDYSRPTNHTPVRNSASRPNFFFRFVSSVFPVFSNWYSQY